MEQDAKGFIADWVRDNIGEAGSHGALGDMSTPDELAELCRAEAREAGTGWPGT